MDKVEISNLVLNVTILHQLVADVDCHIFKIQGITRGHQTDTCKFSRLEWNTSTTEGLIATCAYNSSHSK